MRVLSIALLSATAATACGGGFEERPTVARFDPADDAFWSRPLPSDLRREADGTFDLDKWPGLWRPNDVVEMWLGASEERLQDGWGVSSAVFVPLSGAIDPGTLPRTAAASLEQDATIFLADIDPASPEKGRRFPIDVEFRATGDLYSPENLLSAVPVFGFARRPATLYALVVTTGVKDAAGEPLGATKALFDALSGDGAAEVTAHFAPLVSFLDEEGLEVERVAGAAVFRTFDHNQKLLELARWAEARPQPVLDAPWAPGDVHESYQVLTGNFSVPVFQTGRRPYTNLGEGRMIFGAGGEPEVREMQSVGLVLTVPKQPQPAGGFPLTFVLHGSGGNRWMGVDRGPRAEVQNAPDPEPGTGPAEWLARRGIATIALDFPLHGGRHNPPDTSGLVFYNLFGNIDATIDNFHVAVVELLLLSRLMTEVQLDPTPELDSGAATDGKIRFDVERFTALSQSMGTTLGVPWATVDPRVKGFLFSGAGGILVEIAVTALEPVVLKGLIESLAGLSETGAELHLAHPLLHAFQNVWDHVDPIAKARYVSLEPHPGFAPREVMMTAGVRDGYFHPRSEAAMAVALGARLTGDEVEPILPAALELAGIEPAAYPLQGGTNGKTVGVVQYAAPENLGHYVIFNQEGARHQYTCFLESVGTGAPAIIDRARALDDSCR